jgi:hypothetical protein
MDVSTIISTLTGWVLSIGGQVNDLPGTVAFGLGLFTWFAVEQVLRRILSGMRWVILAGVLAGLGLSAPYLLGLMFERGGPAPVTQSAPGS